MNTDDKWSTSEIRVRLVLSNLFKPSSNFLTNHSKAVLFCGSFLLVVFRVCLSYCPVLPYILVISCWERTDLLALLYVMFSCVLSLSHLVYMVSWVRCGT